MTAGHNQPATASLFDQWIDALFARHAAALSTKELARALRALSTRYVERRATLGSRSPIDSAGKRAAFAVFYGPLHFLTTRSIVASLDATGSPVAAMVDLGCGTGAVSAAWALALPDHPSIQGADKDAWAVGEAAWTWRALGLEGRARRGDLVDAVDERLERPRAGAARTAFVAGWSVNELDTPHRQRLLPALIRAAGRGSPVLVIEPLARGVSPWWDDWARAFVTAGGRADEWKFNEALPPRLAELDEAAGFHRETLGARTLWLAASDPGGPSR
jgi:hypothetical protein